MNGRRKFSEFIFFLQNSSVSEMEVDYKELGSKIQRMNFNNTFILQAGMLTGTL